VIITTEVWGRIPEPWQESGTIIAEEGYTWQTWWERGKPYLRTEFSDSSGALVGTYYDITSPIREDKGTFVCEDLYLDIWHVANGKPVLLDEDELREAVAEVSYTVEGGQDSK